MGLAYLKVFFCTTQTIPVVKKASSARSCPWIDTLALSAPALVGWIEARLALKIHHPTEKSCKSITFLCKAFVFYVGQNSLVHRSNRKLTDDQQRWPWPYSSPYSHTESRCSFPGRIYLQYLPWAAKTNCYNPGSQEAQIQSILFFPFCLTFSSSLFSITAHVS